MNLQARPHRRRGMCIASAFVVSIVFPTSWALAEPSSEDLGASLFEDRADGPESPAARELLEPMRRLAGVGGEAASTPEDWLLTVEEHMRSAEHTLALKDASGRASSTQREAVKELDALLVSLQKQCQKCMSQCNSPPANQNKPPKPGKSGAKPGESTMQAGAKPAKVDRSAVARLVNDRWGRLPERQRDEMLQPLSEEFVPEYAAETEAYFRALAEPRPAEDSEP